jgi:hypothetical protein
VNTRAYLAVIAALLASGTVIPAWPETLNWYRGNTHTHTVNSDGGASPDTVARWYKEHGYQFLFITDHEYVTDVGTLNALLGATERFLALPGQEVTQWIEDPKGESSRLHSAHVNALFARQIVWPLGVRKCVGGGCGAYAPVSMPIADTFRTNIAAIRAEGAIAQINHPNLLWTVRPEDLRDVPDGTLLEVWNGAGVNNLGGDDGAGDVRPSTEGFWDYLLTRGKVIWGVGSDDSHSETDRGKGWIVVHAAELSPTAIRDAITEGSFYASNGVALDEVSSDTESISVRIHVQETIPGVELRYSTSFVGQGGAVLAQVPGTNPFYHFRGNETYVRAAIVDSAGNRAWTQPVFRDGRGKKTK